MATAVVIYLSDDGQMMVGEIEAETVMMDELEPVQTFEDGVRAAEVLLLGEEPPPEIEEAAFNESVGAPVKSQNEMEMEDED